MSTPLIEARGLSRRFGGVTAVDNVDYAVDTGEFRAIIGSNGAGKTTLFNLLTGAVSPSAGSIRFDGTEIGHLPVHRRARLGIGRTFQINNVFLEASVRKNVRLAIVAREGGTWDMIRNADDLHGEETSEIVQSVGLGGELDRVARHLSYGDRRRLELAVTLAGKPRLLLLDEPTCGIATAERPGLIRLLKHVVRDRGVTAILVEHDMDAVFAVAERITVMHRGRIVADGIPDAIVRDPEVRRIYLGEAAYA